MGGRVSRWEGGNKRGREGGREGGRGVVRDYEDVGGHTYRSSLSPSLIPHLSRSPTPHIRNLPRFALTPSLSSLRTLARLLSRPRGGGGGEEGEGGSLLLLPLRLFARSRASSHGQEVRMGA